ncbi:alpha/beta hydrolase [Arthrobacter sp. zg-Y40]|uniref:alpha/beta fold hydrolase n=1 Tax=Arthrobacter sp. zg-Y40 TaxID=2886939 RepID=UPI001D15C754|nr:alpha/beta hydrolase [Arthrobacter sp. zg-Y40]MCC3279239.1 alpha/beta hydrolase [Arthrobacter sp. zg-Y40]
MNMSPAATRPGARHATAQAGEIRLHYVSAGREGSPVLLLHGFPESWWAFRALIPVLARSHRVFAVDLPGFGDSAAVPDTGLDSRAVAETLHEFLRALGVGPVHLLAQDISGGAAFRLAAVHPEAVASFTAVEAGLAGFGLEALADVAHGGSWHIGMLAAPGIPDLLLTGREVDLLAAWAYPSMTAVEGAVTSTDIAEFARTYSRPGGWNGAAGLYRSMLSEGAEIKALAASRPLAMPVLAVGAGGGPFTEQTFAPLATASFTAVQLDGVGHYAAQEAPEALGAALLEFLSGVDG